MDKSLFGTSGIRGSEKELFTDQFCFDLGRTFSAFLQKYSRSGAVAIGLDPRGSSPRIKDAVVSGLVYENREVFDQGATPVPSMCFIMQMNEYYVGSIMVTGSHIKSDLNGIKFFLLGEEILKRHEKEIEKIYYSLAGKISAQKLSDSSAVQIEDRAKNDYIEMLLGLAKKPYPNWKVVVDSGNGAQSDVMPFVLKQVGLNVIEHNAIIQGEFFARDTEHMPDMQELIDKVNQEKADFGIGYDADGDRVVFVDALGNFIPGDYSASLIAREEPGHEVVTTIAASQVIDTIGKKVIRTKVGAPYVIEEMKKKNIGFGFEPNGGCFFKKIMLTRDGGSTTIKFLNLLKAANKPISSFVSELPKFYLFKDKIDYEWEQKEEIENAAKNKYKDNKIETLDGIKVWISATTWLLFRSSLNAPEFRIFAESENEQESQELLKQGVSLVKDVIKN